MTRCSLTVWAILLTLFCTIPAMTADGQTQDMCNGNTVCVLTWQQDTGTDMTAGYAYRTGQNLNDSITSSSFNNNGFGQKCLANLDGQVYAQPLVVTNVSFLGKPATTVVYVVTQNDTVYAIDGTNCTILNPGGTSLLYNNPNQGTTVMTAVDCTTIGGMKCSSINPRVGVLGTPVIHLSSSSNASAGTLYVVAHMQSYVIVNGQKQYTFYHFLHALDITTLNEGVGHEQASAPIQICSDANPCGSYTASNFSLDHIQRPGLLYVPAGQNNLTYDTLYIGFGMMDGTSPPNFPNGVLVGYNAQSLNDVTGRLPLFQTSAGGLTTSNGGGIWMSGAAPAFGPDANTGSNRIYLTTANGTWDANSNWGNSFIELDPATLTVPHGWLLYAR